MQELTVTTDNTTHLTDNDTQNALAGSPTTPIYPDPVTVADESTATAGASVIAEAKPDATEDVLATPANRYSLDAIMATMKEVQLEPTDVHVEEVDDTAAALSSTPAPSGKLDRVRRQLSDAGLTPDQVEKALAIKMVNAKGQRRLPMNVVATSIVMIAFFTERSDEQIETDMVKGIRNDGGPHGPAGIYERVLTQHGVSAATAAKAAADIAIKVAHRIQAIRTNVVATLNELRRRRAVAAGLNAADTKCLRVP
jgi:hypothetical protein